jgi:isopentenyl diphosphate isomerase/L-lactate dehydrogenase-like FMN-dependent dehydrogenase
VNEGVVQSAVAAGAGAIVVTVDFPLRGVTRARPRGGFVFPADDRFPAHAARGEPVRDRLEVYVDGGIRRGADVLRALSLGARAVLVGRPLLWGLACAGQAGVGHVLGCLRRELKEDSALAGISDVRSIPAGLLRQR